LDPGSELPAIKNAKRELTSNLAQWTYPTMIRATGSKKAGVQAAKTFAGGAARFRQEQAKSGMTSQLNNMRTGGTSGAISQQILKKNRNRNGLDHAAIVDEGLV
jgi:hypothetical protein